MKSPARKIWAYAAMAVIACACISTAASTGDSVWRSTATFDRARFAQPWAEEAVRRAGNLHVSRCCVSGWAEYNVRIDQADWYQIWVQGGSLETLVDAPNDDASEPLAYFAGGSGEPREPDKIGNVWLDAGEHRIRFRTDLWNGFSDFKSFALIRSHETDIGGRIEIRWPKDRQLFRSGQCPQFDLQFGALLNESAVHVQTRVVESGAIVRDEVLRLARGGTSQEHKFSVPCSREGRFRVVLANEENGRVAPTPLDVKGFDYEVVDVAKPPIESISQVLEKDMRIDCVKQTPDYASGPTRISDSPVGTYRESGDTGWFDYQRLSMDQQRETQTPSWFAFTLTTLTIGQHYRLEVDYPDDIDRTFAVILREPMQHAYPVAIGVDTGGPFTTTRAIQTASFEFWARSEAPRLVFMPQRSGTRAACAAIHLRALPNDDSPVAVESAPGNRQFVHWYEEGINFIDLFGARNEQPDEIARASDRWAASVANLGGTTLMPTVLVYGGQLYPSRFNRKESYPDRDVLGRLLLSAERFHLKVIAELHPRADALMDGLTEPEARGLLLVSKDGTDNYFQADGRTRVLPPHYNVLLPRIQDWFVNMIGELAERYRDSPAFAGISLRFMAWSNAALGNLVSLDWGYDDTSVRRFAQDTGTEVPALASTDPGRFHRHFEFLTGKARGAWIQWRCLQVTTLLRRIADRIHKVRPDLMLYVHAFPGDEDRPYQNNDSPARRLQEAGLDPTQIRQLPGVAIVDSSASYGRNVPNAVEAGLFDAIRRPEILTSLSGTGQAGRYVAAHRYLEITDRVVPPEALGFGPGTGATWSSLAANPPGRLGLERFAAELADGDALMLGDGGNGYVFSVPGLREFLAAYTRLPALPFAMKSTPDSPVTIRALARQEESWLYAVNRTAQEKTVRIEFSGNDKFESLSPQIRFDDVGAGLRIQLPAFGLFVARASGTRAAQSIKETSK